MLTGEIYAIIPARSGSKSIPDKNVQFLAGKPLIAYSIEIAKKVPEIGRIIVSTDSEQYAQISLSYGAEAPFLRPKEISGDENTDIEWVNHLLFWLQDNEKTLPEYLIHLRPTSPLRDPKYIRKAISIIKGYPEATALRSVCEMTQSVYKHFEIENGFLRSVGLKSFELDLANKPRQMYPKTYDANGYVDVLKTLYILKHNKVHGNRVLPFYVPPITDIDGREDLEYAKYEVQKNPLFYDRIFGTLEEN